MFQNGDRQNAMPMIRRSANRGDPRAQYVLATALFNGDFAEKDWVTAYALMTRASATGLARASSSLAQMDKFIPLEQRQKGLALARDMELSSSRPKLAAMDPVPAPPAPVAVQPMRQDPPAPVRSAPLPQSRAPLMTSTRSALPPPRRNSAPVDTGTKLPVENANEPQWQAPAPMEPEPDYNTPSYEAPSSTNRRHRRPSVQRRSRSRPKLLHHRNLLLQRPPRPSPSLSSARAGGFSSARSAKRARRRRSGASSRAAFRVLAISSPISSRRRM